MIYLDNAATSIPFSNALSVATKFYEENYYNPSSLYRGGVELSVEINKIRDKISKIFGSKYETIFTSCGTEADNTVLNYYAKKGNIVTTLGEHSAIYELVKQFKNLGYDIRLAKLNKNGSVNEEDLLSLVDDKTSLVSVIHINNETGAINDIENLAKKCKQKSNAVFHSDGVQAFLKTNNSLNFVDLYSISGHKVGAIKGIGALIKRKDLHISPFIFGGGQEKGLRSGTENVLGIKSLESAIDIIGNYNNNLEKVRKYKEIFINNLSKDCFLISDETCSPYIISLSCVGLKSEVILHMLEEDGILIGTGSACSKNAHSRVLKECGYQQNVLQGVLRISFGFLNTEEEVLFAVNKLNEKVERLKKVMKR